MSKSNFVAQTLVSLTLLAGAAGCASSSVPPVNAAPATLDKPALTNDVGDVAKVSIDELVKLQEAKTVTVVDANSAETRKKHGVIPGAIQLTSAEDYAVTELPAAKDTHLVFYCGGLQCNASCKAAARATAAGYTNVSVLPDGIKGWKDAGKPTSQQ